MIQYTTEITLDGLLNPVYFGHLTNLMEGNFNLPENCHKDFPAYLAPRNIEMPNLCLREGKENEKGNTHGAFTIVTHETPIFERVLLCRRYKSLCSPDGKNMQMGIATIIRNCEKGGNCFVKWSAADELYDYIMLLRASFGTVEIGREWIICRDFHLTPASIEKIMNYFRYALDCSETVYPFKAVGDKKKLDLIFKKLFIN